MFIKLLATIKIPTLFHPIFVHLDVKYECREAHLIFNQNICFQKKKNFFFFFYLKFLFTVTKCIKLEKK